MHWRGGSGLGWRRLAAFALAIGIGCGAPSGGGGPVTNLCTPGRTAACLCESGTMGVQRCLADGTFGACACAMVGADAGTAPDVVPRADVGSIPDVVSGLDAGGPADVLSMAADAPSFDVVFTDVQTAADAVDARVDAGAPQPDVIDAGPPCLAPRALCGRACVDPRADPLHCGACGVACQTGQACVAGTCTTTCTAGLVACGSRCVDLQNDDANCAGCGRACASGQRCGSGVCGTVEQWSVGWTYPVLVQPPAGDPLFPTYLAHLLGTNRGTTPFPHLACATVRNPTGARVAVTLQVNLPGFTDTLAEQTVNVDAGATLTQCLTPTFSGRALRGITASAPASIQVAARDGVGRAVNDNRRVIVLPINAVIWNPMGGSIDPAWAVYSAVTVRPSDDAVGAGLLPAAIALSRTGSLRVGYQNTGMQYLRTATLVPSVNYALETFEIDAGENYWPTFGVAAPDGGPVTLNAYLFTPSQFLAWRDASSTAATFVWNNLTPGATYYGSSDGIPPPPGAYVLVLHAPTLTSGFRTVRWTRANTREDQVRDALESIFTALYRRGVVYQDLAANYYESATFGQRIRLPAETYAASLANCVDGTVLFASALEAGGFQPVLIYEQGPTGGHAYIGVRVQRDRPTIVAAETTMVSGGDFPAAYARGRAVFSSHIAPQYRVTAVDVRTARTLGVAPIPW